MNPSLPLSRRSFVVRCAATAAASGLPLWFVQRLRAEAAGPAAAAPASPNDRPGIALIGCGGRGHSDATAAAAYGDIVAVCDVDQNHLEAAARQFTRNGRVPAKYTDFRAVLERSDVQVIVQATPDHWHTLVNLAAARAGKDIYGEKPITLTIDEGKRVVRAVREHRVIFQTGSQQRSDPRFRLACELVRNGRIGKLRQVSVFVPAGYRGGPFPVVPVPAGLDWDRWLGQAPATAYQKERCHNTFRWWFEYSGGPVTDWGAHHNDIARWGIGLEGPTSVAAQVLTGPIPGGYTAPSEFAAELTWADGTRQVMKTTPDDAWNGSVINPKGQRNGVKFEGDGGWIWVNRSGIAASSEELLHTPLPDNALRLEVSTNHMGNFFDSVRSRRDPICPIECGHRSASVGHLIVIALRSGRKFQWDPDREVFVGEGAEAGNAQLAREMRRPYDYGFAG
jgi:predicted dehydrogenase